MRMACKSLIWYPKKAYEEGGYSTEPATMQELYSIRLHLALHVLQPALPLGIAAGALGLRQLQAMSKRLELNPGSVAR